jgi:hypothetical protein
MSTLIDNVTKLIELDSHILKRLIKLENAVYTHLQIHHIKKQIAESNELTEALKKKDNKYKYDHKLPYNQKTKEYIGGLRKGGLKVRVRGSGARAKWSLIETNGLHGRKYDSHLPLKYASHVRLYITK